MDAPPLSEEELTQIYDWVDQIPLSRPKKNIARDFSDGVLIVEILAHYVPRLVELHNYSAANSKTQKLYNWNTMNQKVFRRMGFQLSKNDIEACVTGVPEAIERVLKVIQIKIEKYLMDYKKRSDEKQDRSGNDDRMQGGYQGNTGNKYNYDASGPTPQILLEKDQTIQELRETIEILELKIRKLEQLVKLKDAKIQILTSKLSQGGGGH